MKKQAYINQSIKIDLQGLSVQAGIVREWCVFVVNTVFTAIYICSCVNEAKAGRERIKVEWKLCRGLVVLMRLS